MAKEYPNVEVGDMIMSYDFPGRKDCFFIGNVTEVKEGSGMIYCNTLSRIWRGVADEIEEGNKEFQTPKMGSGMMEDDDSIVILMKGGRRD